MWGDKSQLDKQERTGARSQRSSSDGWPDDDWQKPRLVTGLAGIVINSVACGEEYSLAVSGMLLAMPFSLMTLSYFTYP